MGTLSIDKAMKTNKADILFGWRPQALD